MPIRRTAAAILLTMFALLCAIGVTSRRSTAVRAASVPAPLRSADVIGRLGESRVSAQSLESLPVAANGATNPEAIPLAVAQHHFVKAIAIPTNAPSQQRKHQLAMMRQIRFSLSDNDRFLAVVGGVGDELQALARERQELASSSNSAAALQSIAQRESALITTAIDGAHASLTQAGGQKLDRYIDEQVRRRIVIYGSVVNR